MKKLGLILVVLSAGSIAGAVGLIPDFPQGKLALPPLSLAEAARQKLAGLQREHFGRFDSQETACPAALNLALTIIVPRGDADYKGRIVTPDASVDYKLIVKGPGAAPVK